MKATNQIGLNKMIKMLMKQKNYQSNKRANRRDHMKKIRSKKNDLLNYFIHDHKYLSKDYLRSCKKFFKEINIEQKDNKNEKIQS